MKKHMGKWVSFSLAATMTLTAVPVTAMADGEGDLNAVISAGAEDGVGTEGAQAEISGNNLENCQNGIAVDDYYDSYFGYDGPSKAGITNVDSVISSNTFSGCVTNAVSYVVPEGEVYVAASGKYTFTRNGIKYVAGEDSKGNNTECYDTVQAAVNAAKDGTTIVLTENMTGDVEIPAGKKVTLDLNGVTLTNVSGHTITNQGTLTIQDSSEGKTGTVDNVSHAKGALENEKTGIVYIEGGTFTRSKEASTSATDHGGNSWYVVDNQGTMTISGGTITNNSKYSSLVCNLGTMDIDGGVLQQDDFIVLKNEADVTVKDGKIISQNNQALQNWGQAKVTGNAELNGIVSTWGWANSGNNEVGTTTIEGGSIAGNITLNNYNSLNGGDDLPGYIITGGNITGNIDTTIYNETACQGTVKLSDGAVLNGSITNAGVAEVEVSGATVTGGVSNTGDGAVLLSNGATVRGTVSNAGTGTMAVVESSVGEFNGDETISFLNSSLTNGTPISDTTDMEDTAAMIGTKTYETLEAAIQDATTGDTIRLMRDVTVVNTEDMATNVNNSVILLPAGVTLDGNGKKIIASADWVATADKKPANHIVGISGTSATIKDLTIIGNANTKHGINVYGVNGSASLNVSNVVIQNCGTAGMVINGAKVTASNITTSGNAWGGINVDDNPGSELNLTGGSFAEPVQIWTEYTSGTIGDKVQVNGAGLSQVNGVNSEESPDRNFIYFTDDYTKLGTAYNETTNTIYTSLEKALKDASASDVIHVVNDAALENDAEVKANVTLIVEPDVTMSIAEDKKLTNNGTIENKGTISGAVTDNGTITEYYTVRFTSNKTILSVAVEQEGVGPVQPNEQDGTVYSLEKGTYTYELTTSKGTKTGSFTVADKDMDVYVKFSTGSSSSSGGGASVSSSDIAVDSGKHGDVTVNKDSAAKGDKVTITVKPDDGYVLDKLTVKDENGDKIKVEEGTNGKYTFTMPEGDVSIEAEFVKEAEETTEEVTEETTLNFVDVSSSDWFYPGVKYVVEQKIMSGISDVQFGPGVELTRGMMVQMLYNLEGRPTAEGANAFTDVAAGQWYTDAVVWATGEKIVSGMGDNLFAPNEKITREQMVVMLYNYAKYLGLDTTAAADVTQFTDGAKVSAWALDAVRWAVAEGYLSGMGDNTLAPQGAATRAEIASVFMRFMKEM